MSSDRLGSWLETHKSIAEEAVGRAKRRKERNG